LEWRRTSISAKALNAANAIMDICMLFNVLLLLLLFCFIYAINRLTMCTHTHTNTLHRTHV
jgi:hypothetical protein